MRRATLGLLLCHALALPTQAVADALFAGQVTERNAKRVLVAGPDAIGGEGDWALGNGKICAVVLDPSKEGYLNAFGGQLVDLGHCQRGDDRFIALEGLVNLSRDEGIPMASIEASVADGVARLVESGSGAGVDIQTEFALDSEDPERLRIITRLRRNGEGTRLFAFGDVALHVDGATRPFMLAREGNSEGFHHNSIGDGNILDLVSAVVPVESVVLVAQDPEGGPGLAYGLRITSARLERAGGEVEPLPVFGLSTDTVTTLAAFSHPYWIGDDGVSLLKLAQSLFMDLESGDTVVFEREIRVSAHGDVASVTDGFHASGRRVRGRVDDPSAQLHVSDALGSAVTQVAPRADGAFSFRVPPGTYRLEAVAPGGRSLARSFELDAADLDLGALELPPAARVALPTGVGPMRLAFRGVRGTPTPIFGDDGLRFTIGGDPMPPDTAASDVHLGAIRGDPSVVVVPAGHYRVFATRGPEFTHTETEIEARAGETVELDLASPQRALETPGWISADLHVHAAPSDDSTVPLRTRIASFLAEGAEVLVGTDHDNVVDYRPLLRSLGVHRRVAFVQGVEITSTVRGEVAPYTTGHLNAFPWPALPTRTRGGAPRSEDVRLRDIAREVRARKGTRVLQLNHARDAMPGAIAAEGSFFTHMAVAGQAFDPTRPLEEAPNDVLLEPDPESGLRDIDFDAMELLNGRRLSRYHELRTDWFALLRQGYVRTATANSDTHHLRRIAGLPRNYVRMADDSPATFDEALFVRAVREGRVVGSSGPWLEVSLDDAVVGDTFTGATGMLRVAVRAAEWVPVSKLSVYVNGELERARTISAPIDLEIELAFERDAFVTVEVEGRGDALYHSILPGYEPIAFTNPIFVDADADGEWTPPGLPSPAQ